MYMSLQDLAKTAGNLIIMQAEKKDPQRLPSRKQLHEAIDELGFKRGSNVMEVKVTMMGSSDYPIYFALGDVTFALIENYDNNPDGCNRFHLTIPLIVDGSKQQAFPGCDDIDPLVINEAAAHLVRVMRNFTDPTGRLRW